MFQAKLITKEKQFPVEDTIVELKHDVDPGQLNKVVDALLEQQLSNLEQKTKPIFQFLVGGQILLQPLNKHLALYQGETNVEELLNENLVEIEYFLSTQPPESVQSIPHDDWVSSIDANDEYILTASYDASIRIFNIKDRSLLTCIKNAHEKSITTVKIINDSSIGSKFTNTIFFVSCGHDGLSIVRQFNTKNKSHQVVTVFEGHVRSVNCLDVYDNLVATGSYDKTLRIWSCSENNNEDGLKRQKTEGSSVRSSSKTKKSDLVLTGHKESITGVKWLRDSQKYNSLASCSLDNTIGIWDVEVGECKNKLISSKPLLGIDYSQENGLIVAGTCDRHIRTWDLRIADGKAAKTAYSSHSSWVPSVAFGENNFQFVSGGFDNLVKLWDLRSPKACLFDLLGHHSKVLEVNWTNPNYILSGSSDSTMGVYSTEKARVLENRNN